MAFEPLILMPLSNKQPHCKQYQHTTKPRPPDFNSMTNTVSFYRFISDNTRLLQAFFDFDLEDGKCKKYEEISIKKRIIFDDMKW